jgi:hypothetical protein
MKRIIGILLLFCFTFSSTAVLAGQQDTARRQTQKHMTKKKHRKHMERDTSSKDTTRSKY